MAEDQYGAEGFFVNGNKQGYSDAVLAAGGHQMVEIEGVGTAPRQLAKQWEDATPAQKSSKEFVQTWNDIVKELDGTAVVSVVKEVKEVKEPAKQV